jgi:hypothetical protein
MREARQVNQIKERMFSAHIIQAEETARSEYHSYDKVSELVMAMLSQECIIIKISNNKSN